MWPLAWGETHFFYICHSSIHYASVLPRLTHYHRTAPPLLPRPAYLLYLTPVIVFDILHHDNELYNYIFFTLYTNTDESEIKSLEMMIIFKNEILWINLVVLLAKVVDAR